MDFERAAMLLHVVEKSFQHPKLKHIHDAAMKELEAMKVEDRPEPRIHTEPEEPEPEELEPQGIRR